MQPGVGILSLLDFNLRVKIAYMIRTELLP